MLLKFCSNLEGCDIERMKTTERATKFPLCRHHSDKEGRDSFFPGSGCCPADGAEEDCFLQTDGPNQYRFENGNDLVSIVEHNVFPGIWLVFKDASMHSFENHAAHLDNLLEITHCRKGRLEYRDKHRFFFLEEGDMSIHKSSMDRSVLHFPTRRYYGLSVVIHPERAARCISCLLGVDDVDLPGLYRKFCGEGGHFLMSATPRLEHIFLQLYEAPETIQKGYFKVKVLELLLVLSCLESAPVQQERRACTQAQVALAQKAFLYIHRHRGQRISAKRLGEELHVTPEQLRRCVQRVYGKPLYQCVRAYKMALAAEELLRTDRTVMDIAGEFGYDNSSKFSRAFREVMGAAPGDYRQKAGKTEPPPLHFGAKNH